MDWNSTDEQKGNYWDDYNGTDVNHDGIGDTPYIIDADSQDYFPLMEPFGGVPPLSDVNAISPYWNSAFPKNITATASDEHNEVYNVTLWHRFSEDNVTWGVWTTFGLDDAVPWSWSYGFPYGQGFYEFYSVANDSSSNMEIATQTADASCLYNELPVISLVSPQNNSLIKPGSIVTLDVSDGNLNHVDYSEDGGVKNTLDGSYLIDTSNWTDGIHTIEVFAIDKANHSSFAQFEFTIDGTLPTIVSTTPADNAAEVSPKVIITIQFSEAMNKTSVESAFEISGLPYDTTSNFTWNANGTMLIASINSDFDNNETYHVTINATAKDIVGNNLTYYDFTFTTWVDTDLDGIPDSTDTDDDGDGVLDAIDAFPLDPNEWVDTDIDGIGDNADTDDDGDGVPDTEDFAPLDPEVTTEPNSTNGINGYIWIGLCVIIIIIFMVIFLIRKKHSPSNENKGLDAQSKESK